MLGVYIMHDSTERGLRLLAIEASTMAASCALFEGERCIVSDFRLDPKTHHSETLLPLIDGVFKQAGLTPRDLDAVAVTRGPGAFTSVRIGLATARGLAYARRLPVYALSTLRVLAMQAEGSESTPVLSLIDARKGEVYGQLLAGSLATSESLVTARTDKAERWMADALQAISGEICCIGTGALAYRDRLVELGGDRLHFATEEGAHPRAETLGTCVLQRLVANLPMDEAIPVYLRKPEAVVNLEKREKKK